MLKSNLLITFPFKGIGKLNFDSFCQVAVHFLEEDDEVMQKELKEAFRLYDKEGKQPRHKKARTFHPRSPTKHSAHILQF